MKTTKTIAALCAIGMVVSTMAMPVQAKTASKTETEIITMDTPTTTTKAKSKSKTTTKKSSSKATDEYKDWGKDLKVTVHNQTELTQAFLYANMMCAKSLKITFAKDYKMPSYCEPNFMREVRLQSSLVVESMLYGSSPWSFGEYDAAHRTMTVENFGEVSTYFTYAYRTGNTDAVPKDYKELYNQLAKGVKSCTANANSITAVADNVCAWLIDNSDRTTTGRSSFRGVLGKSKMTYSSDGKFFMNCEGYSYIFKTMMHMAGYTVYNVRGTLLGGRHAWNAIKVGDEYRYYDAGWSMTNMTYKEMTKAGYKPEYRYREAGELSDLNKNPTQKQIESQFIDWH